jgi:hypothetical protein
VCFNSVNPLDLVNLRNIERFTTHAISPLGVRNRAKTYLPSAIFEVLKELGLLSICRVPFFILAMLGFAPYGLNTIKVGHLSAFGS